MISYSTDTREIRKFGAIALLFFGGLCAFGFFHEKVIPTYLFGVLSFLGIGFLLLPTRFRPIYNIWLKVAYFIGRIITILILSLAYYLVVTPTALIKRLFSGRPLPIKPDKKVSSYWVARTEHSQPKERFLKRY